MGDLDTVNFLFEAGCDPKTYKSKNLLQNGIEYIEPLPILRNSKFSLTNDISKHDSSLQAELQDFFLFKAR